MLNWLAIITHPDITLIHTLFSQFQSMPMKGYMNVALHVIKYLKVTAVRGLAYTSNNNTELALFVHFDDMRPNTSTTSLGSSKTLLNQRNSLRGYCNANWVS